MLPESLPFGKGEYLTLQKKMENIFVDKYFIIPSNTFNHYLT